MCFSDDHIHFFFFPVGLEIQRKIHCLFRDKALVLQRAELISVALTCAALVLQ